MCILIDPATGAGGYKISSGSDGADLRAYATAGFGVLAGVFALAAIVALLLALATTGIGLLFLPVIIGALQLAAGFGALARAYSTGSHELCERAARLLRGGVLALSGASIYRSFASKARGISSAIGPLVGLVAANLNFEDLICKNIGKNP